MNTPPIFKYVNGVWRLSNDQMTVKIETDDDGNIKTAAPIVYKFIGQPLGNLIIWMKNPDTIKLGANCVR